MITVSAIGLRVRYPKHLFRRIASQTRQSELGQTLMVSNQFLVGFVQQQDTSVVRNVFG